MFDVVIVGSGYGGSVTAARLGGAGRVLLTERGTTWSAGDFPDSLGGLVRAYRHERRNPLGLWSLRIGRGTGNAMASGVGGGSLVNYGITARPDDHTFDAWPVSARELDRFYRRALGVLRPEAAPFANSLTDKAFLDRMEPGRRVDLANTVDWRRCISCGNCIAGCNHSAKRSLDRTYLPLAERAGVTLRSGTEVLDAAPFEGGWRVVIAKTGRPEEREVVSTRALVLAAGTYGTLDLLERLRPRLSLSPAFGRGMSMNGDALAFLYNTQYPLSGEHGAPITTTVRLVHIDPDGRPRTLTIMSGRIPGVVARSSAMALALFSNALGRHRGPADGLSRRIARRLSDLRGVREGGALANTVMYKLDGQDAARGEARFEAGRAVMDWEDYASDPILLFAAERLRVWADRAGGVLVRDLGTFPLMKSFGVHPLGGCRMGADFEQGVVDDVGRVRAPGGVHRGLWVVDGSIVPTSLGVPPSLTIAALAERSSEALVHEIARN